MSDIKHKNRIKAEAGILLSAETASRALTVDSSGNIKSSSVTDTELGYISGLTSSAQTQISDIATDVADLVTLTGVPANSTGLGTFTGGIIADNATIKAALQSLETDIENLPNPIYYAGTWNANTNSPSLADGTGTQGALYRVTVAGSQDLGSGTIAFNVGDKVVYNGTVWEKWDVSDEVLSVNGQTGAVVLDTDDINEGATNLYYTDERAQDAIGTILVDSSSIDFTYNDGTPSITASVLPAGVDHDQLLNYSANKHIDHTAVSITTAADSGLTGGGDISATRSLSVDINGTTAETSADNADKILIYDNSASALKSMTRANFLSGIPTGSAGDINETSFSAANNQASPANVTGLAFSSGVRGFKALVTVSIDATSDLFETFELLGVQKASGFDMSVSSTGDDSGIVFSITTGGQVQYTSTNVSGFVSDTMKFRAISTAV